DDKSILLTSGERVLLNEKTDYLRETGRDAAQATLAEVTKGKHVYIQTRKDGEALVALVVVLRLLQPAEGGGLAANLAWHRQVGKDEIRMSWFLRGEEQIAMVCSADLAKGSVWTAREVHNWATQATHTQKPTHYQQLTLRKLAGALPASQDVTDLKKLVLV